MPQSHENTNLPADVPAKGWQAGNHKAYYEVCFCHELKKRDLNYLRPVDIPIVYDHLVFDEGLRLDVLIEDCIISEMKAPETVNPVWEVQILSHLKLTGKRLGFLINFNVPKINDEIRRFVI